MSNRIGIYKIISPTGRVYIGQSRTLRRRELAYKNNHHSLRSQTKLYNSIQKYGFETHTFEVIEECLIEELNCRERFWQDEFDVLNGGLNCILTSCGDKVYECSKEFREAVSKRMSGKNHPRYGKEGVFRGKHHREDSKKQIGEKQKRGKNHAAKLVLHLLTGIYYDCLKDAAEALSINYSTAKYNMSKRGNNRINLLYV